VHVLHDAGRDTREGVTARGARRDADGDDRNRVFGFATAEPDSHEDVMVTVGFRRQSSHLIGPT